MSQLPYICFKCTDFMRFKKSLMRNNVFFVSEPSGNASFHWCGDCNFFSTSFENFFFHLETHKPELFKCSKCILSFPKNTALKHSDSNKLSAYNCVRCKTTLEEDPKCSNLEPVIFCNIDEETEPITNKIFERFRLLFTIHKRRKPQNSFPSYFVVKLSGSKIVLKKSSKKGTDKKKTLARTTNLKNGTAPKISNPAYQFNTHGNISPIYITVSNPLGKTSTELLSVHSTSQEMMPVNGEKINCAKGNPDSIVRNPSLTDVNTASAFAETSSRLNSAILRREDTLSRNALKTVKTSTSQDIPSMNTSLVTDMLKNQGLAANNFGKNFSSAILLNDSRSIQDMNAELYNSSNQINLMLPNQVKAESDVYSMNNNIASSSDSLEKGVLSLKQFKVSDYLFTGYDLNGLPVLQKLYLNPDQNDIIPNTGLQNVAFQCPSKRQDNVMNNSKCMDINASDSLWSENRRHNDFQINLDHSEPLKNKRLKNHSNLNQMSSESNDIIPKKQNSVDLKWSGVISIERTQPNINTSKLLNIKNLKHSSYPNRDFPGCNDSFQNNILTTSVSLYNSSGNLKHNTFIEDELIFMNDDSIKANKPHIVSEQSEVTILDVLPAYFNNSKPTTSEKPQTVVQSNLTPLEFNDQQGSTEPKTSSDDSNTLRSIEMEGSDKSEFSKSEEVNEDFKSAVILSGVEKKSWAKLKQKYNLKKVSVCLTRLPAALFQSSSFLKQKEVNEALNNSKKLSVALTRLPRYVFSYATYKIYARSQKQKLALQKDENVSKNIHHVENNNLARNNNVNNYNAAFAVDVKAFFNESYFQSPTKQTAESFSANLNAMSQAQTVTVKNELDLGYQEEAKHVETLTAVSASDKEMCCSTSDKEVCCSTSDFQYLSSPRDMITEPNTANLSDPEDAVINRINSELPLVNQHSTEDAGLFLSCRVKKESDNDYQQYAKGTDTSTDPSANDKEMYINTSGFQHPTSPRELVTESHTAGLGNLEDVPMMEDNSELPFINQEPKESPMLFFNTHVKQNLVESMECDYSDRDEVPSFNATQLSVPSTSNSNELNSFQILKFRQTSMPSISNSNVLNSYQLWDTNPSSVPSTSNCNELRSYNLEHYQEYLENRNAFSLWKPEHKLKYLRNRIKYVNETLKKVMESRQNMYFMQPQIALNQMPNSISGKHLLEKPAVLNNILPKITEVRSLSHEKEYYFY